MSSATVNRRFAASLKELELVGKSLAVDTTYARFGRNTFVFSRLCLEFFGTLGKVTQPLLCNDVLGPGCCLSKALGELRPSPHWSVSQEQCKLPSHSRRNQNSIRPRKAIMRTEESPRRPPKSPVEGIAVWLMVPKPVSVAVSPGIPALRDEGKKKFGWLNKL